MFGAKPNKEKERYYLLPGQGGKATRRKHNLFLFWALVAGLVISGAFGVLLYVLNSHR